MQKKNDFIRRNVIQGENSDGISVDRIRLKKNDFPYSHRDEGYTFHILEQGAVRLEIDFNEYSITAPTIVYIHPAQVHRIIHFENITICSLSVKAESMNANYIELLEEITPAVPLQLNTATYAVLSDIFDLCLNFSTKKTSTLHYSLLRDSCNTLVAFMISQFFDQYKMEFFLSRSENITKKFKSLLEKSYCNMKRPAEYAEKLHISVAYLNECTKQVTGFSVSQHIQDRIILEAKRYLYHTDKSVKEISFELGYNDHTYFSKIFKKATGMSALSFRRKNRD